MGEYLLVPFPVNCLYTLEFQQFRKDIFKEAGLVHKAEAHGRFGTYEDLVEFLDYPLL